MKIWSKLEQWVRSPQFATRIEGIDVPLKYLKSTRSEVGKIRHSVELC